MMDGGTPRAGRVRISVTGFQRGTGTGKKDSPDTYQLRVTRADGGGAPVVGTTRWSECEALEKALKAELGARYGIGSLPKKRRGVKKLDDQRLEKRRDQLEKYLADVVALAERCGLDLWSSPAMRAFQPQIFAAPAPAMVSPVARRSAAGGLPAAAAQGSLRGSARKSTFQGQVDDLLVQASSKPRPQSASVSAASAAATHIQDALQRAVAADQGGQAEQALGHYERALELMLPVMKSETHPERKQQWGRRMGQYMDRAEAIKRELAGAKSDGDAVCSQLPSEPAPAHVAGLARKRVDSPPAAAAAAAAAAAVTAPHASQLLPLGSPSLSPRGSSSSVTRSSRSASVGSSGGSPSPRASQRARQVSDTAKLSQGIQPGLALEKRAAAAAERADHAEAHQLYVEALEVLMPLMQSAPPNLKAKVQSVVERCLENAERAKAADVLRRAHWCVGGILEEVLAQETAKAAMDAIQIQVQIQRREQFAETLALGERHLAARNAQQALHVFHESGRRTTTAEEDQRVQDCVARAASELERQKDVMHKYHRAMQALEDGAGPNPQRAIELCEAALEVETDSTAERESLLHMLEACRMWVAGDLALADQDCSDALAAYEASKHALKAASSMISTDGYYGDGLGFSDGAIAVVRACMDATGVEATRIANLRQAEREAAEAEATHTASEATVEAGSEPAAGCTADTPAAAAADAPKPEVDLPERELWQQTQAHSVLEPEPEGLTVQELVGTPPVPAVSESLPPSNGVPVQGLETALRHSAPQGALSIHLEDGGMEQPAPLRRSSSQPVGHGALNAPGFWDVMISYTQRNPHAMLLASELFNSLEREGRTVWLDVKMQKLNEAAMQEAVENSRCVLAIVTGVEREGDAEDNAYFKRDYCVRELRWAQAAGVPIQPVIRAEDKQKIGQFIHQAPSDLQDLGKVDFIHLDRSRPAYWEVGIKEVMAGMDSMRIPEGVSTQRHAETILANARAEAARVIEEAKAFRASISTVSSAEVASDLAEVSVGAHDRPAAAAEAPAHDEQHDAAS